MSLKGGWALAHLFAFLAGVIKRLLGLSVDQPGTMLGSVVLYIICLGSGAIVAIWAFVWKLLLVLSFNMFL